MDEFRRRRAAVAGQPGRLLELELHAEAFENVDSPHHAQDVTSPNFEIGARIENEVSDDLLDADTHLARSSGLTPFL
jgi:hypothetical protein